MLQPDLLQGHEVLRQLAAPLEDSGIGTLGQSRPGQPQSILLVFLPAPPFMFLLGLGFKLGALHPLFKFCLLQTRLSLEVSLSTPWLEQALIPVPVLLLLLDFYSTALLLGLGGKGS